MYKIFWAAILDFGNLQKMLNRYNLALNRFGFSSQNPIGINQKTNFIIQNKVPQK
jgi:hypothetical protein